MQRTKPSDRRLPKIFTRHIFAMRFARRINNSHQHNADRRNEKQNTRCQHCVDWPNKLDQHRADCRPDCPTHREEAFVTAVRRLETYRRRLCSIGDQRLACSMPRGVKHCSQNCEHDDPDICQLADAIDQHKQQHRHSREHIGVNRNFATTDAVNHCADERRHHDARQHHQRTEQTGGARRASQFKH